eukprot:2214410-Karenia_brevis.AAC.1
MQLSYRKKNCSWIACTLHSSEVSLKMSKTPLVVKMRQQSLPRGSKSGVDCSWQRLESGRT